MACLNQVSCCHKRLNRQDSMRRFLALNFGLLVFGPWHVSVGDDRLSKVFSTATRSPQHRGFSGQSSCISNHALKSHLQSLCMPSFHQDISKPSASHNSCHRHITLRHAPCACLPWVTQQDLWVSLSRPALPFPWHSLLCHQLCFATPPSFAPVLTV